MDYKDAAKKELEEYSKLMQTEYAWLQEQEKRKRGASSGNLQRIPLGEAAAEGKHEEKDSQEAETLPDEWLETGLNNMPITSNLQKPNISQAMRINRHEHSVRNSGIHHQ